MVRLSRKFSVCKWVGTAQCVLILVALVFNGWWHISYGWETPRSFSRVGLSFGRFDIERCWKVHSWDDYPDWVSFRHLSPGWDSWHRSRPGLPEPFVRLEKGPGHFRLALPLWIPLLALIIPTLLLWRRERRRAGSGFCLRCDYDLTGNVTGACPECGTAITDVQRALLIAAVQSNASQQRSR